MVPVYAKARANEIAASHMLAVTRLNDLRTTLQGTPFEGKVPQVIDFEKPGVETVMQRYQTYVSHNASNLADPYQTFVTMGADKRDAKTGELQPNPDAKYVDSIASALGGWPLLQAAHQQIAANGKDAEAFSVIDTESKATAVLSSPKRFTPEQQSAAKGFLRITQSIGASKAAQDARAHATATGADVEAMYKFGTNPVTKEKLSLDNSPDAMLVNPTTGQVVPQNLLTLYKPTAQQKTVADGAKQVLAISADLRQAIQKNPGLVGPLLGCSREGLSKLGLGTAESQKMLDDLSLLQSATAKVHAGGRMSNEILQKVTKMLQPGFNPSAFGGALDSIDGVMARYAQEDHLTTVGDFKTQQNQDAQQAATTQATGGRSTPNTNPAAGAPQHIVPAGATPGRDAQGTVIGYRLANGNTVRF